MNPKVFLAFAAGVLLTGGATYFLSQPPAKVASVSKIEAVKVAEAVEAAPRETGIRPPPVADEPPVTPDRVISAAGPAVAVRKPRLVAVAPVAAKPSPARPAEKPASVPIAAVNPVVSTPDPVVVSAPLKVDPIPPPPLSEPIRGKSPEPVAAVAAPPPAKPNVVTIAAGTSLTVRLQDALSSEKNRVGDSFQATLDQAVVIEGFVIAERGARVEGRITELDRSGKVKGVARLVLELTKVTTSDGQHVAVQTVAFERKGETTRKSDVAKVGLGAVIGAAIGGIAGGGKGAATGAGVGGAAGAGGVLLTRGKAAELAAETRVTFRLQEPLTLTERLH